ncbi:hypothetical protein AX15_000343 [Amanita polypyramis BW_CC]|nr:hypothetical protein AX15_000343 [Amanita polypyramis BW_CC]
MLPTDAASLQCPVNPTCLFLTNAMLSSSHPKHSSPLSCPDASTGIHEDTHCGDSKGGHLDKSSLPSPSILPPGFVEKAVVQCQNASVVEDIPTTALPSFLDLESEGVVSGHAAMSVKISPPILVTISVDDCDAQLPDYGTVDSAEDFTKTSPFSHRIASDDKPNRSQCRPQTVADNVPMIYRPLSQPPSPSRLPPILLATTSASRSDYLSRSPRTRFSGSSSSSNLLMDADRPTVRLLAPSSALSTDFPSSMSTLKGSGLSLRTLAGTNDDDLPSSDYLSVPTPGRRRSASLRFKETSREPSPHKSSLPQASGTSWLTSDTYLITPRFSRSGLNAPGVVLPLTVKEFQERREVKEGKKSKGDTCGFSETSRCRTRYDRREGAEALTRASGINTERGSGHVLPLGTSAPPQHGTTIDPKKSEGTLKAKVEGFIRLFNNPSRISADKQMDLSRRKDGRGGAASLLKKSQFSPAAVEKDTQGGGHARRKYFKAIFVHGGSRERAESSNMSKGIPILKERRQAIMKVFSKIVRK